MAKRAGKLARRYARALLRSVERELGTAVAAEGTPAQAAARSLSAFAAVVAEHPDCSTALESGMFPREERRAALLELAKRGALPEVVQQFLGLVFERDRLDVLGEITQAFTELANEAASVIPVEIFTASALDGGEQAEIESALRAAISGKLEFSWAVDAKILGGMIVRYAGRIVDGSLSGRLEQLERALLSA